MKLLFIVPRFHTNLSYRLKALTDYGYMVELAVLYRGGSERTDTLTPRTIGYCIFYRALLRLFSTVKLIDSHSYRWRVTYAIPSPANLMSLLRTYQPDVVFIRANKSLFTACTMILVRLSGRRIFLLMQTDKYGAKRWQKKIIQLVLTHLLGVRKIITPLKNTLAHADPLYFYAPFVIDVPETVDMKKSAHGTRIISIGKFQERKDHLLLLRAIKALRDDGTNISLTIVGEPHDRQVENDVEQFVDRAGLAGVVEIRKEIPHAAVRDLYQQHDIFVLPSYNEPAAFSVLEAMSAGLPVIVSDTCGTKGYIEEGKNGLIFQSRNRKDLEKKIETIINSDQKKMGELSKELVFKNHSPARYAETISSLFT